MPNIKSAKKRVKVIATKTLRNKALNSNLKTTIKKAEAALAGSSDDRAPSQEHRGPPQVPPGPQATRRRLRKDHHTWNKPKDLCPPRAQVLFHAPRRGLFLVIRDDDIEQRLYQKILL